MEVLYRNQPLFGAQPAAMVFPSSHFPNISVSSNMFASPSSHSQAYTCYPFQAGASPSTPSRTPTPDYPSRSRSHVSSPASQGTTLKSVLRGEVPEAYSHLLSPYSSPEDPPRHPSPAGRYRPYTKPSTSSAVFGQGSATVLSPPPENVHTEQTEPMDLSFKRPSSTSSSASSPASFHLTFPPSPCEDHQGQSREFSLLRNLLQVGKDPQPSSSATPSSSLSSASVSGSFSSASSERSCDSPCSDSGFSGRAICGTTRVTLAKKNKYPISTRVSDWLMKMVQFATSSPDFQKVHPQDRLKLILNSWSRLLLLYMAENNLQFAVTPLVSKPSNDGSSKDSVPSADEPTMKSVQAIQNFIAKCQNMGLEVEEYDHLRLLVLFNCNEAGLRDARVVEKLCTKAQQSLQKVVTDSRPGDSNTHYARLLMCLPSLIGISPRMVESLFCSQMDDSSVTDVEVLLSNLHRTYDRGDGYSQE